MSKSTGGLAGVVAGDSKISTVGLGTGLNYRGYSIEDLSEFCTFQQVAFLLLFTRLPTQNQLKSFKQKINAKRWLPDRLVTVLKLIPKDAHPMDVMRTISSIMGIIQPQTQKNNQNKIAIRMLAIFGPALLFWYHYAFFGRSIATQTDQNDSIALNFMKLLHQKKNPDPLQVRTFDVSLILYAQHDFNASTFCARVVTSTMSDFYSGITAAIGALRGPLHGGANQAAMDLLGKLDTVQDAKKKLQQMWSKKQLVMGFGHRVYKKQDPRSPIIKSFAHQLAKTSYGNTKLLEVANYIQGRMVNQKKIFPNLDFYSAVAYNQCGIKTNLFTPIFVMSRTAGWAAHIFQQRSNNKLIRPLANYVGPTKQKFIKLQNRAKL